MQLDKIRITDIKPAKYNPRQIDIDNYSKLIDSLNTYGLIDPIIINLKNNNTIIGGHQRFNIIMGKNDSAKELNILRLGDIGWVFDEEELRVTDENMEKLMNITLNQNNLMGEWNNAKLESLFTEFELEDAPTHDNVRNENTYKDREELNNPVFDIFGDEPEPPAKPEPKREEKKPEIPTEEPSFDETIADDIETIKCPNCGYEIPK